jgi:hypothetical protein
MVPAFPSHQPICSDARPSMWSPCCRRESRRSPGPGGPLDLALSIRRIEVDGGVDAEANEDRLEESRDDVHRAEDEGSESRGPGDAREERREAMLDGWGKVAGHGLLHVRPARREGAPREMDRRRLEADGGPRRARPGTFTLALWEDERGTA